MRVVTCVFSFMAAAMASKNLHYSVPNIFKAVASNCTMPADYVVNNFTTYTDKTDASLNTVSFRFLDADTNIDTTCQRNSTSKPGGPSKNRYDCGNANVAFIYQTTGVAGLTLIEKACPGSAPQFEASGLITPELTCVDSSTGTLCHAQARLEGDFDSFEPVPPKAPVRRVRGTWRN
ncbi:hypothetical protein F5Y19DRAFT_420646 [Xylariaceae sp. FL1651]|nr:hypothetical protein F5Y19DRAFT_420646 [Xylariaceae sp. FL1651]